MQLAFYNLNKHNIFKWLFPLLKDKSDEEEEEKKSESERKKTKEQKGI